MGPDVVIFVRLRCFVNLRFHLMKEEHLVFVRVVHILYFQNELMMTSKGRKQKKSVNWNGMIMKRL